MSDDINPQDNPMIIGEPLTQEQVQESVIITPDDLDDAVDWWNSVASPLFVNAIG